MWLMILGLVAIASGLTFAERRYSESSLPFLPHTSVDIDRALDDDEVFNAHDNSKAVSPVKSAAAVAPDGLRHFPGLFGGVMDDFRRRRLFVTIDYTNGLRYGSKTLSSALFMMFATLVRAELVELRPLHPRSPSAAVIFTGTKDRLTILLLAASAPVLHCSAWGAR